jgi:hypothetical protein
MQVAVNGSVSSSVQAQLSHLYNVQVGVCGRACVRACVCACVRACVRMRVRVRLKKYAVFVLHVMHSLAVNRSPHDKHTPAHTITYTHMNIRSEAHGYCNFYVCCQNADQSFLEHCLRL